MSSLQIAQPFVGRELLLDTLDRVRDDMRRDGAQCRIVVHGIAGIGSSSLAAAVADRWGDSFPDGVLHLLVGDGHGSATTGGLVRSALIQLNYPARELPDSEADQAAVYRQRTAGKRLLVVFDGVAFADQIAHLVPSSPSAAVIATTRRHLGVLVVHQGWRSVRVPALDPDASRKLLRAMLDVDFDVIDAATVATLLRTCAGHPLAIRVVGGTLAGQPEYAVRLAADMGEVGIGALKVDDVSLVLAVLDSVYDGLTDSQRAAYRNLSADPGPDFGLEAAAVSLEADAATTQRAVRSLVDANLLERGEGGRIGFHSLIRDHARLTARTASLADFQERQHRIIEWYRDTGVRWESRLTRRWRESEAYRNLADAGPPDPDTRRQALDWLTVNLANIEAAVTTATDIRSETRETDQIAVDLGFVLWTGLHLFGYSDAVMDALRRAVEAARRLGDLRAAMQLTSQLGTGLFAVGDLDAADRCFAESGALAAPLRHGLGQQSALEWRGKVAAARRRFDEALRRYDESEAVARTPGLVADDQLPRVLALLALHRARVLNTRSEYGSAAAILPDAVRYFATSGEGDNHAKVSYAYGRALLGLGDVVAARERLRTALDLFQADKSLRRQAETHALLADAYPDDRDEAQSHLRRAEEIYRELDDTRSRDMSARLRAFDPGPGDHS